MTEQNISIKEPGCNECYFKKYPCVDYGDIIIKNIIYNMCDDVNTFPHMMQLLTPSFYSNSDRNKNIGAKVYDEYLCIARKIKNI